MALSHTDALETARELLDGARMLESARLERIHCALKPRLEPGEFIPSVAIPDDAPALMKELARKSETNYLGLLVKSYRQVIKADGYYSQSDDGAEDPWVWWQRNLMDAQQAGIVDSALKYGVAYSTVLPGTWGREGKPGPTIKSYTPRTMTAVYQDPTFDEWPMLTLSVDGLHVTLMDEEQIYRFGIEKPWYGILADPPATVLTKVGALTFIDSQAHETGIVPVVRFRDRNLLAGEEQLGIVEPLMTLQERLDETTYQMSVAQYFQAFKQRYIIGWVPRNEQEELKAGAARQWYIDEAPGDVRVDELQSGEIKPYIDARNSALRDFAANGQLPVQTFGIDGISNISDAALTGLEAAKNREASEINTSLGESFEQMMRLCAHLVGNHAAADDYSSEIRWKNFEARSFAGVVDALGKLVTQVGLDPAIALEDVPGFTDQKLERAQQSIRRANGAKVLEMLNQAPSSGSNSSGAGPA